MKVIADTKTNRYVVYKKTYGFFIIQESKGIDYKKWTGINSMFLRHKNFEDLIKIKKELEREEV